MILHPLLTHQLADLGLNIAAPPDLHTWQQLLQQISTVYQADQPHGRDLYLFQQTDDAVLVVNAAGQCLTANQAAKLMFGQQSAQSCPQALAMLLPSGLVPDFMAHINQALLSQTPQRWAYQFSDHNLTRYQEAQATPIALTEVLVIVRDVTERKWADETARVAREYFRRLIQDLHVGMLIYGPNAELLLSNHRARELFALNDDQIWGETSFDQNDNFVQEDGSPFPGFTVLVQQLMASDQSMLNTVIGVYRPHYQDRIWLLVNAKAQRSQATLEWVTITLNDITDLRHVEAALRESEKLYQSLVYSVREVIFQIDGEGVWIFLNPAWTQITGFSLPESIGQRVLNFIHPDDRAALNTEFSAVRQGQTTFALPEIRCLTKTGGFRWLNIQMDLILSADQTPVGFTGTLTDITERKQSEVQAAELAGKEKLVVALRTLLDYLSHDLRTPLSVINANLFLVRRKLNDTAAVQGYVTVLEQQTARLAQIIDDVVTVSSLDNEIDTFEFTYLDLNQLMTEVLKAQDRNLSAKKLILDLQLSPHLPRLRGDRIWLTRMIKNLILNAIQYTLEQGTITVTTRQQADAVLLIVADTGIGIDPVDLPHIFEHFYRGDKTRPMHSGGAGLGLTIVKKVVEAHRGEIEVESTVGQGSTFYVHLPLRP